MKGTITLLLIGICTTLGFSQNKNYPKDFNIGSYDKGYYMNDFFKFTIVIPETWVIQEHDFEKPLKSEVERVVELGDKKEQKEFKAAKSNTTYLTMAYKHKIGNTMDYNPSVMIACQYLIDNPELKTGKEYLFHVRQFMHSTVVNYTLSDYEYNVGLDNVYFDRIETKVRLKGREVTQEVYAAVIKDFGFSITISYEGLEQQKELHNIINTIKFLEKPRIKRSTNPEMVKDYGDTIFQDLRMNVVYNKRLAKYYRLKDKGPRNGIYRTYFLNNNKASEWKYKDGVMQGPARSWYKNGSNRSKANYKDGLLHGELTVYYPDGRLKRKDSYEKGVLSSGKCYNRRGKDTVHYVYGTHPEYYTGNLGLRRLIQDNQIYPKKAKGAEGIVLVQFIVELNGTISNVRLKKSVNQYLDEEALRVIGLLDKWTPAIHHNVYARQWHAQKFRFNSN
ncbi:MAG: TonB family protein [Bacteroidetes bacterium]|nr:TonB family protein [Bacteroidota bacterium]